MASDQGFNALFSMAHRVTGGEGTASGVGGSVAMQDMRSPLPDLVYYPDTEPGIRRRRAGRGFCYYGPGGSLIRDPGERLRIASLAVPPAYEEVWICPLPDGHLQATGFDARGRKQYRYHPRWTEFRAQLKYGDLAEFGRMLPRIRRRIARDLSGEPGERAFAVAAVLAMIDRLSVRVGSAGYAEENGTYGATTLRHHHLKLTRRGISLRFPGKGGKEVHRQVRDARLGRVLHELDDLPGATLVSWLDDEGRAREVTAGDVNAYLAEVSGEIRFTAKTFRTWNGSVAALEAVRPGERTTIRVMAEAAAERLGNTPTIARNSYIHPQVLRLAEEPERYPVTLPEVAGLRADERRLLALLEAV
jgi:DNA topoisomerase-1